MTVEITNYTYTAAAKTIAFDDYVTIDLANIISVINITTSEKIYFAGVSGYTGSVATNVLTFIADNSLSSDSDSLLIFYDDPAISAGGPMTIPQPLQVTLTGAGIVSSALKQSIIAGEVINGGKAVFLDTDGLVYVFDITNPLHYGKCVGIAETSVIAGDSCLVVTSGLSTVLGIGWIAGAAYYIDTTGFLTDTAPALGWVQQVGVGLAADTILIELEQGLEII